MFYIMLEYHCNIKRGGKKEGYSLFVLLFVCIIIYLFILYYIFLFCFLVCCIFLFLFLYFPYFICLLFVSPLF